MFFQFSDSEISQIIPPSMKGAFFEKLTHCVSIVKDDIYAEVIFQLCEDNAEFRKDYIEFNLKSKLSNEDSQEKVVENENVDFYMPNNLFDARMLYRKNLDFKEYVDLKIKPFLVMDTSEFVHFLCERFPEISKMFTSGDIYKVCYSTRNALFGKEEITQNCFNWCEFFFNFETIKKLQEVKPSGLSF
jgi:hypothetical protein